MRRSSLQLAFLALAFVTFVSVRDPFWLLYFVTQGEKLNHLTSRRSSYMETQSSFVGGRSASLPAQSELEKQQKTQQTTACGVAQPVRCWTRARMIRTVALGRTMTATTGRTLRTSTKSRCGAGRGCVAGRGALHA